MNVMSVIFFAQNCTFLFVTHGKREKKRYHLSGCFKCDDARVCAIPIAQRATATFQPWNCDDFSLQMTTITKRSLSREWHMLSIYSLVVRRVTMRHPSICRKKWFATFQLDVQHYILWLFICHPEKKGRRQKKKTKLLPAIVRSSSNFPMKSNMRSDWLTATLT